MFRRQRRGPGPAIPTLATAAAMCLLLAGGAGAQDEYSGSRTTEQPVAEEGTTDPTPSLENWDPSSIQGAMAVSDLIGAALTGGGGREIATVTDLLIDNESHQALFLLIEGDLAVPWDELAFARLDGDRIQITRGAGKPRKVDAALLADAVADVPGRQPKAVRASELRDKDMLLNDAVRYGEVTDLILDQTGRLVAVEAQYNGATVTRYALPVPDQVRFEPEADNLYLPYDFANVRDTAPVSVGAAD